MQHLPSRQPTRQPWTFDELKRMQAKALINTVDHSTSHSYASALNSWLAFVDMHHFLVEPNTQTLSFFIVYMSHHINPRSIKSYLSGLVQQLEPDYPQICEIRSTNFINKVMRGCLRMRGTEIQRKKALTIHDIISITVRGRSTSSDVSSDISPSPLYIPPHRR